VKKSLTRVAATVRNNAPLAAEIVAAEQRWQPVFAAFTADYKNDEDSIQRPGSLRESIPRTGLGAPQLPPTAAQLDYAKRFDAAYAAAMQGYNAYIASLGALQSALQKAGIKPIEGLNPLTP